MCNFRRSLLTIFVELVDYVPFLFHSLAIDICSYVRKSRSTSSSFFNAPVILAKTSLTISVE